MRIVLKAQCLAALAICVSAHQIAAAKERVADLHHFSCCDDGYIPEAPPTLDPRGNLFGTTAGGGGSGCGGSGCGIIYELLPVQGAGWSENVLYRFQNEADGVGTRAMLARDKAGALYGSDSVGQFYEDTQIYRLAPSGSNGAWSFSVLYVFDHTQGIFLNVYTPLLYGLGGVFGLTTNTAGDGTLFKLDPAKSGSSPWKLRTLLTFVDEGLPTSAVAAPDGHAIYVAVGNSVVSVSPPRAKGGTWSQTLLYEFKGGKDGEGPGRLVAGDDGAIYGIADLPNGRSIAFALANNGLSWRKVTVQTFSYLGQPVLAWASSGSLYGTSYGDQDSKPGSAFRLDPPTDRSGRWIYVKLANFRRGPSENPIGITLDRRGNVFGTLEGQYDGGAVFELRDR